MTYKSVIILLFHILITIISHIDTKTTSQKKKIPKCPVGFQLRKDCNDNSCYYFEWGGGGPTSALQAKEVCNKLGADPLYYYRQSNKKGCEADEWDQMHFFLNLSSRIFYNYNPESEIYGYHYEQSYAPSYDDRFCDFSGDYADFNDPISFQRKRCASRRGIWPRDFNVSYYMKELPTLFDHPQMALAPADGKWRGTYNRTVHSSSYPEEEKYGEIYQPDQWYPIDPLVIHTGFVVDHTKANCAVDKLPSLEYVAVSLKANPYTLKSYPDPDKFGFTSYETRNTVNPQCFYWRDRNDDVLKLYELDTVGMKELWYNDPNPIEFGHRHGMPLDWSSTGIDREDFVGQTKHLQYQKTKSGEFRKLGQPLYEDFRELGQLFNVKHYNSAYKPIRGKSIAVQLMGTIYKRTTKKAVRVQNNHIDFRELHRREPKMFYQDKWRDNPKVFYPGKRQTYTCSIHRNGIPFWDRTHIADPWTTETDCNYRDWALTRKYAFRPNGGYENWEKKDQLSPHRVGIYVESDYIPWAAVGCKTRAWLEYPDPTLAGKIVAHADCSLFDRLKN